MFYKSGGGLRLGSPWDRDTHVGSDGWIRGHASSIALGIALQKPDKTIWCIDGDGAALMHMGAIAVIGKAAPENLIHVVINNQAHESVGGMPTAADTTDLCGVAAASGYRYCTTVEGVAALQGELGKIRTKKGPVFLEVKCAIGARDDLGRPTSTPQQNKGEFMGALNN